MERVCIYAETEGTLTGLRDAAMIRLMSDCLLRISEVVAVNVGDLKEKTLTIQSSKTDQESTGESLYVCETTRNVLNRYRERAGITRGALFRHIRRGDHIQPQRLTPHSARRIIQKRAADAGVEGFISGAFAPSRICCLPRTSRCNRRRYASRRTLEILTNAGTLCQSRVSRARRNREV